MKIINNLLKKNPFIFDATTKNKIFLKEIIKLTNYHKRHCKKYKNIINFLFKNTIIKSIENIPFIHASTFKFHKLVSVKENLLIKKMTSSGTTRSNISEVYLDKKNLINQKNVLINIVKNFIGSKRLPMIICDNKNTLRNSNDYAARVAAIQGFSIFGIDPFFLYNDENEIDYKKLNFYLKKYKNKQKLIFGFTFQLYESLILKLDKKKLNSSLGNSIIIHGGGWKKMEKIKVSNKKLKKSINKKFNIKKIYNYYGVIEQAGSIFFECKCGYFVTSIFSDVLIRDENFNICEDGKTGYVQLISLIPTSYPGHSILTEDIGKIVKDDCSCNLKGKKFIIIGRVPKAEMRGCSDI